MHKKALAKKVVTKTILSHNYTLKYMMKLKTNARSDGVKQKRHQYTRKPDLSLMHNWQKERLYRMS
jgi:hypothetical protein